MTQVATIKQIATSVVSNTEVIADTYLIWLNSPTLVEAQPGQFLMVRCEGETLLRRPLSIHQLTTTEGNTKLALFFSIVGKGTHWLSRCKAGDTLDILAPLGNSYTIHPSSHNLLLVAGGIGIAPLLFLAQRAIAQGYAVKILLGATSASRLYPQSLLPPEAELIIATDDGSTGRKGMLTDILSEHIDQADQIFVCGPRPMYLRMANMGFKEKPIQLSLETRMGCGFGACYSCTIKTKHGLMQVCKDGPIFELNVIRWDGMNLKWDAN